MEPAKKSGRFRMPAEWEAHEATWLVWPHHEDDWPGKFEPIPWVFTEMVRKISPGEKVRIIAQSQEHQTQAAQILERAHVDLSQIAFYIFQTDRGWTRDTGPIFVFDQESKQHHIVKFQFNAWAKYPNWQNDNQIAEFAGKALGYPLIQATYQSKEIVLEGGAIDVNGAGTLITTEECLLDKETQARNPDLTKKEIEQVFHEYLGITNVLWLGKGIIGDDTHGHVDDLCRFVTRDKVVLCQEENPKDENYAALQENRERLETMRLEDGGKIEVIPLPMPDALYFEDTRLPASYANFYICNHAVLVPTFNDPNDRLALGILAEVFQDKIVVGIHAVDLVWGFGTIHCLTQQQPGG